jgi:hypothetical protein
MTNNEGAELHKRVERYEAAVDELRAAHEDVRELLLSDVLFERWQQLGADLGFSAMRPQSAAPMSNGVPQLADSWAS